MTWACCTAEQIAAYEASEAIVMLVERRGNGWVGGSGRKGEGRKGEEGRERREVKEREGGGEGREEGWKGVG